MDEADMGYAEEKEKFAQELKAFAATLAKEITQNDEWTIRGFIDILIYSKMSIRSQRIQKSCPKFSSRTFSRIF